MSDKKTVGKMMYGKAIVDDQRPLRVTRQSPDRFTDKRILTADATKWTPAPTVNIRAKMHYINCSKCGQGGMLVETGTTATTCPTCDKVAAETARCIGIVQTTEDVYDPGHPDDELMTFADFRRFCKQIISEIRGAN